MQEVTTTLRNLKVVCDWYIEDHEDLDKEVTITWDDNGFVGMYNPEVPDGGYIGLDIDYDEWVNEDLPKMQEANELWDEKYH